MIPNNVIISDDNTLPFKARCMGWHVFHGELTFAAPTGNIYIEGVTQEQARKFETGRDYEINFTLLPLTEDGKF